MTEAVDAEITKTAEVEKQTEPVESQPETVETPAKIFVDVCGAVANPGVYEMEDDSRIFQVIEAAGGFLPEAAKVLLTHHAELCLTFRVGCVAYFVQLRIAKVNCVLLRELISTYSAMSMPDIFPVKLTYSPVFVSFA